MRCSAPEKGGAPALPGCAACFKGDLQGSDTTVSRQHHPLTPGVLSECAGRKVTQLLPAELRKVSQAQQRLWQSLQHDQGNKEGRGS